jgi:preprotein translocase SecE subunit
VAEETDQKPKRRVRKVETVREKTAKSIAEAPTRRNLVWQGFTAPFRLIGRGIASVGRALGKYRFFRVLGRIVLPRYFRNSWKELRQVIWPTGKQTRQLTGAVLLFAIIFGVLVATLDFGLDKVFKEVLLK